MRKKELKMGIIMAVIISAAMGVLATFIVIRNNPQAAEVTPVPVMYISNIILSIVIGVIVALAVPLGKLGQKLAKKFDAVPPSLKFTLINAVPISIGNTLIIGFILSGLGVYNGRSHAPAEALANLPPFYIMWLGSFLQLLLPTLIVSYVISVLISPVISRAVGLGGPPPEAGRGPKG